MAMSNKKPFVLRNTDTIAIKVAKRHLAQELGRPLLYENRNKVAGEIRFIKDQGPLQREIPEDFYFDPKHIKPLTRALWSMTCSLGHLTSAHTIFNKIKAVNISPDGKMGGKGYIQEIREMRTALSDAMETISNTIDTFHDEIRAAHWQKEMLDLPQNDKKEVDEIIQDTENIMSDPETYVEKEYREEILNDIDKSN